MSNHRFLLRLATALVEPFETVLPRIWFGVDRSEDFHVKFRARRQLRLVRCRAAAISLGAASGLPRHESPA